VGAGELLLEYSFDLLPDVVKEAEDDAGGTKDNTRVVETGVLVRIEAPIG
jgi:hypothetical protein